MTKRLVVTIALGSLLVFAVPAANARPRDAQRLARARAASRMLLAAPAGDPQTPDPAQAAWNGTDIVTASVDLNGNLYAYEQVPGAKSWTRETVATASGGTSFRTPWVVATGSAVQIVAAEGDNLWFWQQEDGTTSWSAPQLVGTTSALVGGPKIAWTGVPGHAGTNSVIAATESAGDVLFFYQNGSGGWSGPETVAAPPPGLYYEPPALTATDQGIVIVSSASDGAFFSWFQPYGGTSWDSDGSVGVGSGQSFGTPSVTWDGTNVDVADAFDSGGPNFNELVFLWKSDSDQFWSDTDLPGPSGTHTIAQNAALAAYANIYHTSDNLIISSALQQTQQAERVDFWWQGGTFTNFNLEEVVQAPNFFGPPTLVSTTGADAEVAIVAPETLPDSDVFGLKDWTQPVGATTPWTPHTIEPG